MWRGRAEVVVRAFSRKYDFNYINNEYEAPISLYFEIFIKFLGLGDFDKDKRQGKAKTS